MSIHFGENANLNYLDKEYQQWEKDPRSVDPTLNGFFTGLTWNNSLDNRSKVRLAGFPSATGSDSRLQTAAVRVINTYRDVGHLIARVDPLMLPHEAPEKPWILTQKRFELSDEDLKAVIDASIVHGVSKSMTIGELIQLLEEIYCGSVGYEYMHIQDLVRREWLCARIEPRDMPALSLAEKYRIIMSLKEAQMFEDFLQTKYLGHKRFGLEGGETLIPILDAIVERAPALGVKEIVMGMAHRGRLNVLCNILEKPYEELFNEFEDRYDPNLLDGDGDVKYHMGFSADVVTSDGNTIHLTLAPNPSHLECVNPVVVGRTRAKQKIHHDEERIQGVPLLIHGDAAFAGQGVVPETLNMANLAGYRTGGTIHIVINNQIGFTTPPRDSRSTEYCTDIAKFIQAPIFHVNAEDPEACVRIARLALEYRQEFKSDVVIDMVCYRKLGHNETDEPSLTSPIMYRKIAGKPRIANLYTEELIRRGDLGPKVIDAIHQQFDTTLDQSVAEFDDKLKKALEKVKNSSPLKRGMKGYGGIWSGLTKTYSHDPVDTTISQQTAETIAHQFVAFPEGFVPHPKLADKSTDAKGVSRYPSGDSPFRRRDDILAGNTLDWGTAEMMAYGSLLMEGFAVRLSGQDSRRGTFSHRHAVIYDYETGKSCMPFADLARGTARFDVFDSHLSEMAVLGYEYGYSLDSPNTLVLWEAQFGDFANGAQVIIDQFICSAETKWNRSSGLVMLLPHGYEGAGPEHSSARLERFLQLCAENNIQVANFTTPAQIFHALRRQMKRNFRKPLIVMTPKSLLRHPLAQSPLTEFTSGSFHEVLDDPQVDPQAVRRVILCTGKIYYDLLSARMNGKVMVDPKTEFGTIADPMSVALVRVEQLYPWPAAQLQAVLDRYPGAEIVWAQEEPRNMGAWTFVAEQMVESGQKIGRVARTRRASPAVGSKKTHDYEQAELIEAAFNKPTPCDVE